MTKRILVAFTFVIFLSLPSGARATATCVATGASYPSVATSTPGASAAGQNLSAMTVATPAINAATPAVCVPAV